MKHFLFLAVSLFFNSYSFSQKINEMLSKKYSSEELIALQKVDSEKVELINYSLQNACYVISSANVKKETSFDVISVADLKNINYLELGLSIIENENQYFSIQGTDKMLVVKSAIVLKLELSNKK